jgi:hypothetical protein
MEKIRSRSGRALGAALAVGLALGLGACATEQKPGPSREETVVRSFQARVVAIDHKTREVTLLSSAGERVSFQADEAVRNLDQVKVGDVLVGEVEQTLLVEARAATPEEQSTPAVVAEAAARAPEGERPAGVYVRQVRALFTITSIDKAAGGGTLRDVEGQERFVKARDPAVLDRLRVGDTVVVTFTEALRLQVVSPGK